MLSLTASQLDALRELSSIGAGHAATALSQLVDRKIVITVPELRIVQTEQVPGALGGPEAVVCATFVKVLGDARGALLFVVDEKSALALAGLLANRPGREELDELDHELLTHAGSVLLSAYLNALSRMVHRSLVPSPPAYASDMVGAILQAAVTETEGYAEESLLVDADFLEQEEGSVRGRLFFLPAPGSLEAIVSALGVT